MDTEPKCPWWRRKRWRLVIAVWFATPTLYFASLGPFSYAWGRWWISDESAFHWYGTIYQPGEIVLERMRLNVVWSRYSQECYALGDRHNPARRRWGRFQFTF